VRELQRLRRDHAAAVLAFERANRRWFARSVSDRGDDYFAHFDDHHAAMLAEQAAGAGHFHVLVDADGAVQGRFNLFMRPDGSASVGYRVAEAVAGAGVATAGLLELCELAGTRYGLTTLTAVVSHDNLASRRVLEKAGFTPGGPGRAGPHPGTQYHRPV
jgi:ribosomal-protein-alanine N-acetyltransferase